MLGSYRNMADRNLQKAEEALDAFMRRVLPDSPIDFRKQKFIKQICYISSFKFGKFSYRAELPMFGDNTQPYEGRLTMYTKPGQEDVIHQTNAQKLAKAISELSNTHTDDCSDQESNSHFCSKYENLPDAVLLKIFSYLSHADLCRVSRVCTRWYRASRSPSLWKYVNIEMYRLVSDTRKNIIPFFQSTLVYLRICFLHGRYLLEFTPLLEHLRVHCPHLKVLMLENAALTEEYNNRSNQPSYEISGKAHFQSENSGELEVKCIELKYSLACFWDLYRPSWEKDDNFPETEHRLPNLSAMSLRKSFFHYRDFFSRLSLYIMPNIKVLDLTFSTGVTDSVVTLLPRLTHLEELYLSGCKITDDGVKNMREVIPKLKVLDLEDTKIYMDTVRSLRDFGRNLKKLYLCNTSISNFFTHLEDGNLVHFPELEILCLRNVSFHNQNVEGLFRMCPKLNSLNLTQTNISEATILRFPLPVRERVKFERNVEQFVYCDHYLQLNLLTDY